MSLVRLLDGVAKSPLDDLRGVPSTCKPPGPVGDACFRFLEWLSGRCCRRFSRRARDASRFLSRVYSLYFAAIIKMSFQPQIEGKVQVTRVNLPISGFCLISSRPAFFPPCVDANSFSQTFSSARTLTAWSVTSAREVSAWSVIVALRRYG